MTRNTADSKLLIKNFWTNKKYNLLTFRVLIFLKPFKNDFIFKIWWFFVYNLFLSTFTSFINSHLSPTFLPSKELSNYTLIVSLIFFFTKFPSMMLIKQNIFQVRQTAQKVIRKNAIKFTISWWSSSWLSTSFFIDIIRAIWE